MRPLTFSLRFRPDQRLDLSALTPDRLAGLTVKDIEKLEVGKGKSPIRVGDAFKVTKGTTQDIRILGGSDKLDRVGEAMSTGSIHVEGDAGARLARAMSGGGITVSGSTGPWAGSAMSGGSLTIGGNTGPWLGGPLVGELSGMRGGTILVKGSAAEEAGHRLRRGTIVISGSAGDYAARSMIAGTLVICGTVSAWPGYMMRRGTLILGHQPGVITPTLAYSGNVELVFTDLLARSFLDWARPAAQLLRQPLQRLIGDLSVGGRGEILLPR